MQKNYCWLARVTRFQVVPGEIGGLDEPVDYRLLRPQGFFLTIKVG